jgi:2-C-methyl-D-erythritol 2,4-cyclodiphosphate synthase
MYLPLADLARERRPARRQTAEMTMRVGIGYDIHRFAEGRKLVLGGVQIDAPLGLSGHSDGDAILHAVIDALLGAAGLPDIGDLFPDTDPAYHGADSRGLLKTALAKVREAGYRPNNIDLVVHAEKPKLTRYKAEIAASLAQLTGLERTHVSVKAKTNEGLGPVGHGEALACTAVVTVVED